MEQDPSNFNGDIQEFQRNGVYSPSKPLVHSITAWGGLVSVLGSVGMILTDVSQLPAIGPVGAYLALGGGIAAIIGRTLADQPISGILPPPKQE